MDVLLRTERRGTMRYLGEVGRVHEDSIYEVQRC